jgi:hypothetical protein
VELGTGFDVILIPNLLHSLDRAANELLLKKTYGALASGGRVIVVEFAPNEDRVSPRLPALFALAMLANGCCLHHLGTSSSARRRRVSGFPGPSAATNILYGDCCGKGIAHAEDFRQAF